MPLTQQDYSRRDKHSLVARIRGLDSFEDVKELLEAVVAVFDEEVHPDETQAQFGTAALDGVTEHTVTFLQPFTDETYVVALSPSDNRTVWVTDKLTTGFTLHVSASLNGAVDWVAVKPG